MHVKNEVELERWKGVVNHARCELLRIIAGDDVVRSNGNDDIQEAKELSRQVTVGDECDAHLGVIGKKNRHRGREALCLGGVEESLIDIRVCLVTLGIIAGVEVVDDALLREGVLWCSLIGEVA